MANTPSNIGTAFKVIGIITLIVIGFGLIGLVMMGAFYGIAFIDGFASIGLGLSALFVAWKWRIGWNTPAIAGALIGFFAFLGMFIDARGNVLYNLPLEWLFAPPGTYLSIHEVVSHGGSSTGVNLDFNFINSYGKVVSTLSMWIVYPFRFIQYILIGSGIVSLTSLLPPKRKDWLPEPPKNSL